MNKYKIVALFGPAGSGKDYILKHIIQTPWGKISLHPIISCTTRPPREGEKDGVDYYFKSSQSDFFSTPLIECSCFRKWWYGTSLDFLDINKINIGIFNINGINQILDNKEINCLPIRIKTLPKIRLLRQLQRENEPDCDEIIRRYLTDQKDFLNIPFHYHIIENNYDEIQSIINEIIPIITHWSI